MTAEILIRAQSRLAQNTGPGSAWVQMINAYKQLADIQTSGSITTIYKGYALPGSDTADSVWRISRIVVDDSTGTVISETFANNGDFSSSWDARATLSYV